jgi:hypothetical protein
VCIRPKDSILPAETGPLGSGLLSTSKIFIPWSLGGGWARRLGVFSRESLKEAFEKSSSVVPLQVLAFSFRTEPLYLCADPTWSRLGVSGMCWLSQPELGFSLASVPMFADKNFC